MSSRQHITNNIEEENEQYSTYSPHDDAYAPSQSDDSFYDTFTTQPVSSFHALQENKPNLPCFPMMRTGTCSRGTTCTFSHKKEHLLLAWKSMFADLQSSPFNPKLHPQQSAPLIKKQYNITNDMNHMSLDDAYDPTPISDGTEKIN